jgi:hypothetical protein
VTTYVLRLHEQSGMYSCLMYYTQYGSTIIVAMSTYAPKGVDILGFATVEWTCLHRARDQSRSPPIQEDYRHVCYVYAWRYGGRHDHILTIMIWGGGPVG